MRLVIAHEFAHVTRQDWAVLMTSRLICAAYWFHPLAWWAAREIRRLSEHACDDVVLKQGVNPMTYSQQLIELARSVRPRALSTVMSMAGSFWFGSSGFESRIKAILAPANSRRGVNARFACLAAGIAVFGLVMITPSRISAQAGGGIVAGSAQDPSGAALPGVTIVVSNGAQKEVTTTNDAGDYRIAGLAPGTYRLIASLPGFWNFERTVTVAGGAEAHLSIDLGLGEASQTVTVAGKRVPVASNTGAKPQRIRVGGNVQATKLLTKIDPVYPAGAQQRQVEGSVLLHAVIGTDGGLYSLSPVNTLVDPELTKAATDAVSRWRYEPTLLNGEPVEVETSILVNFKLN